MDSTNDLTSFDTISGVHIPRWNELPEFELYMDQVIGLAEKHLGALYVGGKELITSSMINNYVKSGVLPPPKNKKYNRTHLAILMIVCAMKSVMEISAISDVISRSMHEAGIETVLDEFARMFETELSSSAKKAKLAVSTSESGEILSFIAIENTLKASACRAVAMQAYDAMRPKVLPESEKKKEKDASEKASKKKDSANSDKKKKEKPEAAAKTDEISDNTK